ncbi:MAG TPA: retropepsin-like aspartic protease [Rhodopila sp.]|nr:retropepsin-like aspartic protease [Rhodopila sp.]
MSARLQAVGVVILLAGAVYSGQQPSIGAPSSEGAPSSDDEHRIVGQFDEAFACYVNVTVDGAVFRMLVDTGSDDLAFNRSHLRKLGMNAKRLSYDQLVNTSNGIVRSAPIVVHELRIGGFILHDVKATVDYAGIDEPLLGMSVIKYMHLEIGRDGCELRW